MYGNPLDPDGRVLALLGNGGWPGITDDCDDAIAFAVTRYLASVGLNDAIIRISRTIGDRRRRAKALGLSKRWWRETNQQLDRDHLGPLRMGLDHLEMRNRFAANSARTSLDQVGSFLEQDAPFSSLLRWRTDVGLILQHLEQHFDVLRDILDRDAASCSTGTTCSDQPLMKQIAGRSLRQWLAGDGGVELELLLQYLVLGEYYTEDASTEGYLGVFERARDLAGHRAQGAEVEWNLAGIDALLLALTVFRSRFKERQAKLRDADPLRPTFFCELCDELTQRMTNEQCGDKVGTGSTRYCERHDSSHRGLYRRDLARKELFGILLSSVLSEAKCDEDYRRRLVEDDGLALSAVEEHARACPFCSGHPIEPSCLDPESANFLKLIAFHANARKVAYRLSGSLHSDGRSYLIDEAMQGGLPVRATASGLRLSTSKAAGQHSGIALARLIHNGLTGSEIARRLGVSPSAVSQRMKSLTGCFDFTPSRDMYLVWWPFDDLGGDDVIKFSSNILWKSWKHSPSEYQHLARTVGRSLRRLDGH